MATKEARGTKRTCRNEDCETKFYDLNRDPIVCPVCDTVYRLTSAEEEDLPVAAPVASVRAPVASADDVDADVVSDDDDALVSLEDADAELGADDDDADDDAFLEDDDNDTDGVGDIIGGVETEDEES